MQIDFDLKLHIRPTFIQFGSMIAGTGIKNTNIYVEMRYIEHTFKHLSNKMRTDTINF